MNTDDFAIELTKLAKRLMSVLDPDQVERSKTLGKQFMRSMRKGGYNGAEMSLALTYVLLSQLQPVLGQPDAAAEEEDEVEMAIPKKPKRKKEKKRAKRKRK